MMMSELLSYDLALFSIGIVIIGGFALGLYHIVTFNSFKARQAENKIENSIK
jgi:hypothetical protein